MFDGPPSWAEVITGTVKNHTINAQLEESAYNQRFHQGIFGIENEQLRKMEEFLGIPKSSKYLVRIGVWNPEKPKPEEMFGGSNTYSQGIWMYSKPFRMVTWRLRSFPFQGLIFRSEPLILGSVDSWRASCVKPPLGEIQFHSPLLTGPGSNG